MTSGEVERERSGTLWRAVKMAEDSDLRAIFKLLQMCGLAPYLIGKERKDSRMSVMLCTYNVVFASMVMLNMVWAEKDDRNNIDYPNKSFLLGVAFDVVDVMENVHLCFVSLRSMMFTGVGTGVWFKIKRINEKLRGLHVGFNERKFGMLIYTKAVLLLALALLFLASDIILCSKLDIFYTANYWILCGVPLIHNFLTEVSFGGFALILYQRFWAINEFLKGAIDCNKETCNCKMWQQKSFASCGKPWENAVLRAKASENHFTVSRTNLKEMPVRPPLKSAKGRPPFWVMMKNHNCFGKKLHIEMIRSLKIVHFDLFDVANDLNCIFGWNLLFIFATSFFGCIINMYFVIIYHIKSYEAEQYISCLSWMSVYLFKVLYLTIFANKTSKEAKRTTDLLHVLQNQTDLNDTQMQVELRAFCLQNSHCKVKFKAAEFFTVDRSILFQGRGLFAMKHFSKEDIIFEEIPLVSCQFSWNEDYGYLACELCLRPLETATENVKRLTMDENISLPYPDLCNTNKSLHVCCPHCGIKYCSAECLEIAWSKYHKTLCLNTHSREKTHPLELLKETWKQMHYPPETTTIMLLVKIFALVHQSDDKESIKNSLKQFCHITTNENENITHKLMGLKYAEQLGILREAIINVVPTEDMLEWTTPEGFVSLMALVGMNGQGIGTSSFCEWVKNVSQLQVSPEEKEMIDNYIEKIYETFENVVGDFLNNEGSGLYYLQSSVNHSCRPNAEITFPNGNYRLAVKAKENVNPGDEICISYLDECILQRNRHSRQKILQENYLFTCKCQKCLEEMDQPDETSSEESEYEEN